MINSRDLVFADTSAFIALIDNSDLLHGPALSLMAELTQKKARLFTSEAVLFELGNGFSKTIFRDATARLIDQIRANPDIEIEWSSQDLFNSALKLYRDRPDKDWSLTDCTSFILMKEHDISLALTSDKHFEQAGFVKLLDPTTGE